MSEQNLAAVQAVYDGWSRGDFTASVELFDPEIVMVMRPQFPDAGTYHGTEAVAEYTRGFLAPWTRIAIEAEELLDAGDQVLVRVRQHGTGKSSGIATELRYYHLWTLRGGRAIRLETIRERAEALAAVGLA